MGRLHLFELEDFSWYPRALRDMETDLLRFFITTFGFYDGAVPHIARCLERAGSSSVVDLCSGGSGPWSVLYPRLSASRGEPLRVTLTDLFPNLPALERARDAAGGTIAFSADPVDATAVPEELEGVRTLFSSFHHFRSDLARAILRDAWERRVPIAVFEFTGRSVLEVVSMFLAPLAILLATPCVRPFRVSRLFWTYLIPVIPLVGLWNGVVSCLRTYSLPELTELVREMQGEGYVWEVGRVRGRWGVPSVRFLVGCPSGLE